MNQHQLAVLYTYDKHSRDIATIHIISVRRNSANSAAPMYIPNCCKVDSHELEADMVITFDRLAVKVSMLYEVPVLMEAFDVLNVELVGVCINLNRIQ